MTKQKLPRLPVSADPRRQRPGMYSHPHDARIKLRVHPTGRRSWFLRIRVGGKQEYVDLGDVSVADAYTAAARAFDLAKRGISPRAERELAEQRDRDAHAAEQAKQITFAQVRAALLESPQVQRLRRESLSGYLWGLDNPYVRHLDERPIRTITRHDIERIERSFGERYSSWRKCGGTLRTLFHYATAHGHLTVDANPMRGYKIGNARPRREPFLKTGAAPDWSELVATLDAIDRFETEQPALVYPDLWRMLCLTGLRPKAIETLEWQDVNLHPKHPTLTIRAENAKLREQYQVPLSQAAVAVLRKRKAARPDLLTEEQRECELVFPSQWGTRLQKPDRYAPSIDAIRGAKAHGWLKFRPQRFRDTFISWAEWRGLSYLQMCRLVGWGKPGELGHYSEQAAPSSEDRSVMDRYAAEVERARAGAPSKVLNLREVSGGPERG